MTHRKNALPSSESNSNDVEPSPSEVRPQIPLTVPYGEPQAGMSKIGDVAKRLDISVQAIRLYESEGLLISFKSEKGTRWYTEEDIQWISRIKGLISEGLNFAGIRRLLAQIPCWSLKPCRPEDHAICPMRFEARMPCWIAPEKLCTEKLKECYHCNSYRRAPSLINLISFR
jgi:hypothetical protein